MNSGGAEEFRESFFQECEELLETMHDGFSAMVDERHDDETIHAIFRAVHSIKGGAGAFGLDTLVAFAHRFETGLDAVRAGRVVADPDLLSLFQRCGDHLSDLVAASMEDGEASSSEGEALCESLTEATGASGPEDDAAEPDFEPVTFALAPLVPLDGKASMPADMPIPDEPVETRFTVQPSRDLFESGSELLLLFQALSKLGDMVVDADLERVPPLSDLVPLSPEIAWSVRLEGTSDEDAIRDVFEFVSDCCEITMLEPDTVANVSEKIPNGQESDVPAAPAGIKEKDPELMPPNAASKPVQSENAKQDAKSTASGSRARSASTIRVDLDRVDKLINLVGELVIKEAMLTQSVKTLALDLDSGLSNSLEGLKQLAGEIQEGVMAIRAQPIKPVFQRMERTVRDASIATGKSVRLVTKGEYTEVDKTVLERLVDPLTHMIRNAVDHGLEDAGTREESGKTSTGTIVLSAAHRSGRVVIEIADDGAGINRERVRAIAEAKGFVEPDEELSAGEIDGLLFMPGFSSKEEVSELSGRGVGLDVARNEIESLGGRLAIQSTPGQGSTFSISLPLTLAVLEGMVVDVAGQTMIVPITAVRETLQPQSATVHAIGDGERVLETRDGLVPLIDLGATLGFETFQADGRGHVMLVVETEGGRQCGIVVDAIQDQRQVVIKSLETNYQRVDGISAATILGDGRIALIIDPDSIAAGATRLPPVHSGRTATQGENDHAGAR